MPLAVDIKVQRQALSLCVGAASPAQRIVRGCLSSRWRGSQCSLRCSFSACRLWKTSASLHDDASQKYSTQTVQPRRPEQKPHTALSAPERPQQWCHWCGIKGRGDSRLDTKQSSQRYPDYGFATSRQRLDHDSSQRRSAGTKTFAGARAPKTHAHRHTTPAATCPVQHASNSPSIRTTALTRLAVHPCFPATASSSSSLSK